MLEIAKQFENKPVFKTHTITQKKGKHRVVNNPHPDIKPTLKEFNKQATTYYQKELARHGVTDVPHAYLPKKSIKTNAKTHQNAPTIIKFDFSHFFDDVRFEYIENHLYELIPEMTPKNKHLIKHLLINPATNGVTQGLPPSGALAGLALVPFWRTLRDTLPNEITFTQYSDDLIFSCQKTNQKNFNITTLTNKINNALTKNNLDFTINAKKTKIQNRHFRRVTGVSLNHQNKCTPSVKNHRWLRSFAHILRQSQDLEETLRHFEIESLTVVNGKISYMQSIDETGKIQRLLTKNSELFRRFGILL